MLVERIGSVSITAVEGSPNLYFRFRRNGRQITRSAKTSDLLEAREIAKSILSSGKPHKRMNEDHSFNRYVLQSIENDKIKVRRGERAESLIINDQSIYKRYCKLSLGENDIRNINYQTLLEFVEELTDRGLSSSSIKRILVLVSKALKTAARVEVIQAMPLFPEINMKQKTRGWFSKSEYQLLLEECLKHEKLKSKVRSQTVTPELRRYISFMVNTFLRPSDSRQIQHRHIEVVTTNRTRYLRISTDFSKTVPTPVISMPMAVDVYLKQLRFQRQAGFGKPDNYVFLPQYQNRKFASEMIRRPFSLVCKSAGLSRSPNGDVRSLYSLRHTAIMFRLIEGDKVDLLTLARNARTSVEMIDRFYAKHLTAEMNVEKFQS